MHTYRIEIVLIIISLGALLFVLGSMAQVVSSGPGVPGLVAQSSSTPVPAKIQDNPPKAVSSTSAAAARPANCVALPAAVTPGPASPSPTLAPIAHTFDLAPNLAQDEKSSVLVLRCDGSWDQFWLAPAQVFDPQKELKAGDVAFATLPAAGAGTVAAPPTPRPAVPARTPTRAETASTSDGYPGPQSQSTQEGYPKP